MKHLYKIIGLFCLTLATIIGTLAPMQVHAEDHEPVIVVIGDDVYEFADEDDYLNFKLSHDEGLIVDEEVAEINDYGQTEQSTLLWRNYVYGVFLNYHPLTPYWSKASSYTITADGVNRSLTATLQYNGFTFSLSYNRKETATISFSADSSRYSRLGISADLIYARYKVDVYSYGTYSYTYYVNTCVLQSTSSTYVAVYYQ